VRAWGICQIYKTTLPMSSLVERVWAALLRRFPPPRPPTAHTPVSPVTPPLSTLTCHKCDVWVRPAPHLCLFPQAPLAFPFKKTTFADSEQGVS
jgi:hypothetical protein